MSFKTNTVQFSYLNAFLHPGMMIVGHPEIQDTASYNQFCLKLLRENSKLSTTDEVNTLLHKEIILKRTIRFDVAEDYGDTLDRFMHDNMLEMLMKVTQPIQEMKVQEIESLLQQMNQKLFPTNHPSYLPTGMYRDDQMQMVKEPGKDQGKDYQKVLHNISQKITEGEFLQDFLKKNLLTKEEEEILEKTIYMFPSPKEVPALMKKFTQELLVKFKQGEDPIAIACFAHQELTDIHPFNDGNGRTARAIMNLILKQAGRKPVIFVSDQKYTEAVRTRDKDPKIFEAFIRNCVEAIEAEERLDTWYSWGSVLRQVLPKGEPVKAERSGS